MYRKLTVIPLLCFIGAAAYQLYDRLSWKPPLQGILYGTWLPTWDGGIHGLWFVAFGIALCWAAAFYPGRPYPVWQRLLKYSAVAGGLVLAGAILYSRGALAGRTAFILQGQTQASPLKSLLASFLLGALPEAMALSLFLAAPVYWLVRGVAVHSLQRATFEAWVEAKRLIIPGVVLLVAGVILDRWAGPALTTWILR